MAIWQFTFYLVPRAAVDNVDGAVALVIGALGQQNSDGDEEDKEEPNYWIGHSPQSFAEAIGQLLPQRKAWSEDALMFGDERGDTIELWDDSFRVRLDLRQFNELLARAVVSLAADSDLKLVAAETGRLISPAYAKVADEIAQSRAFKFARDPIGTLRMIGMNED